MLVQLTRQKDEQESDEETDDEINDFVEHGSSQNISQQFNRQARIDTDTSSRHSENLFEPQPPADLVATKTINPFSKNKPAQEAKDENGSSVFDSMSKPEVKKTTNGGIAPKNMRQKLA